MTMEKAANEPKSGNLLKLPSTVNRSRTYKFSMREEENACASCARDAAILYIGTCVTITSEPGLFVVFKNKWHLTKKSAFRWITIEKMSTWKFVFHWFRIAWKYVSTLGVGRREGIAGELMICTITQAIPVNTRAARKPRNHCILHIVSWHSYMKRSRMLVVHFSGLGARISGQCDQVPLWGRAELPGLRNITFQLPKIWTIQ